MTVAGSCARASAPVAAEATTVAAPPRAFLDRQEVDAIIEAVSGARSLPVGRPIRIEVVSRPELEARVREETGRGAERRRAEETLWVGLDFIPPSTSRSQVASHEALMAEQIAAYYDVERDVVVIPRSRPSSEREAIVARAIVAHEIEHALQARRFRPLPPARSGDEALARLALVEGDAQVAMGAYLGSVAGAPVGRTLRRIREATREVPKDALARHADTPALSKATALARARLDFPYEEGMEFVSDLYRAGGFELVNRAFERPPSTTEQILHPEKFLRGEAGRPVGPLPLSKGDTALETDTLGELSTRILFERCATKDEARRAAEGWDGDRAFVFRTADGARGERLVSAWVSAWDSEEDAREVEGVLGAGRGCFGDNDLDGRPIGAASLVRREGAVVALVRGAPKQRAEIIARALLSLPQPRPDAAPVSDLVVPPRVPLPEPERGRVEGDTYRSAWLGIEAALLPGMIASSTADLELVVDAPREGAHGAFTISTRIASRAENDRTFEEIRRAFRKVARTTGLSVHLLGERAVSTGLGEGVERTWEVGGTSERLRAVLVPICAGTGSLLFLGAYGDKRGRATLDRWMGSFHFGSGRSVPACDYLDPK